MHNLRTSASLTVIACFTTVLGWNIYWYIPPLKLDCLLEALKIAVMGFCNLSLFL
jgi:hypothetical protein